MQYFYANIYEKDVQNIMNKHNKSQHNEKTKSNAIKKEVK